MASQEKKEKTTLPLDCSFVWGEGRRGQGEREALIFTYALCFEECACVLCLALMFKAETESWAVNLFSV